MGTEDLLNLGAITFELGVPVAAIAIWLRAPRYRKRATVVLGAIMPLLLAYGWMSVSYLYDPTSSNDRFVFFAMWMMSFVVYVILLVVGLLLALIPRPNNLYGRFAVGFALAPLSYVLFSLVS